MPMLSTLWSSRIWWGGGPDLTIPPTPTQRGTQCHAVHTRGTREQGGCVVRREGLGRVSVPGSRIARLGDMHGQPIVGWGVVRASSGPGADLSAGALANSQPVWPPPTAQGQA